MNKEVREFTQRCMEDAVQVERMRIGEWLEKKDRGFVPGKDYWFLPLIMFSELEALKRGEEVG